LLPIVGTAFAFLPHQESFFQSGDHSEFSQIWLQIRYEFVFGENESKNLFFFLSDLFIKKPKW
jgi:hypothetical protein